MIPLDETAYGQRLAQTKPVPPTPVTPSDTAYGERLAQTKPAPVAPVVPTTVFTPVATIVTQNGEEIAVDQSGRAEDGSVPVGTTKPVEGGTPYSVGGNVNGSGATGGGQDNTKRQSAYDLLYQQFNAYGLGALVEPLKGLITDAGVSPSEFTIRLRDTDAYKKRFAANQARIQKGLAALDEADYIAKEDAYQNIMRNYGLPATYYTKGDLGRQEGFEKLIANDVSALELEDRIATAQQRVINSNPEVLKALKSFYPDINNADILAYALNPEQGLADIKRKVTAAEIGGAALQQGLKIGGGTAETLAGQGVTKAQAQQGYANVAEMAPRGSELAAIYGQTPYTQQTAEAEVFNTAGAADAAKQRKKLTELEKASFSGSAGVGALGRDRALYGASQGQAGTY